MHAIADQSIDNLHICCVFGQIPLKTVVTKVEDGYKLKYDVYQVTWNFYFLWKHCFIFRSNVAMSQ